MSKTALIILSVALLFVFGFIFLGNGGTKLASVNNVKIKDGVQYIAINAGGGYSPRISSAKAGIPTKLIVETKGAFDCSSFLVIHSVGFQKILPQTGETEIGIGIPKADESLKGVCGMGMYSFQVNFEA
ncbi:hypothetical protein HYW73_01695 [Candidatus Nomurabacteria bacterium]|nr:hypothetical protein [Candidatus Nomurabacteria bacterium]